MEFIYLLVMYLKFGATWCKYFLKIFCYILFSWLNVKWHNSSNKLNILKCIRCICIRWVQLISYRWILFVFCANWFKFGCYKIKCICINNHWNWDYDFLRFLRTFNLYTAPSFENIFNLISVWHFVIELRIRRAVAHNE